MPDTLRTRIAAVIYRRCWPKPNRLPDWESLSEDDRQIWLADADAVILELPELRRIDQVREVCVASLNLDRFPGEALSDRAWLADTVLNVLNGEVDE